VPYKIIATEETTVTRCPNCWNVETKFKEYTNSNEPFLVLIGKLRGWCIGSSRRKCKVCGEVYQNSVFREYIELSIDQKILFNLGYWQYSRMYLLYALLIFPSQIYLVAFREEKGFKLLVSIFVYNPIMIIIMIARSTFISGYRMLLNIPVIPVFFFINQIRKYQSKKRVRLSDFKITHNNDYNDFLG